MSTNKNDVVSSFVKKIDTTVVTEKFLKKMVKSLSTDEGIQNIKAEFESELNKKKENNSEHSKAVLQIIKLLNKNPELEEHVLQYVKMVAKNNK